MIFNICFVSIRIEKKKYTQKLIWIIQKEEKSNRLAFFFFKKKFLFILFQKKKNTERSDSTIIDSFHRQRPRVSLDLGSQALEPFCWAYLIDGALERTQAWDSGFWNHSAESISSMGLWSGPRLGIPGFGTILLSVSHRQCPRLSLDLGSWTLELRWDTHFIEYPRAGLYWGSLELGCEIRFTDNVLE